MPQGRHKPHPSNNIDKDEKPADEAVKINIPEKKEQSGLLPLPQNITKSGSNMNLSRQSVEVHVEMTETLEPELEKLMQTDPKKGLSDAQVEERLLKFGKNQIPEKRTNPWLKFLSYFMGPISFLLEIATIISAILGDWVDFGILVAVLVLNACIGFFEEARAENALDALKNTLALKSRCWRNGQLVEVDSYLLVPGDIIGIRLGDIIPADCRLLGLSVTGDPTNNKLHIDQSALTGESLPVTKGKGATAYSSSICKQGQMLAVVTKTGIHTYIGRAANLISITTDAGHFQKTINRIGNFLIIITVVMAVIILLVDMYGPPRFEIKEERQGRLVTIGYRQYYFIEALKQVVVLIIAAIPVGLPTVLSVTMAVGAKQLAKKKVIVKRLTAIEELASVSVLCSDKTGTLTMNQLSFDEPYLAYKGSSNKNLGGNGQLYTADEILFYAFIASEPGAQDPIESAVRTAAENRCPELQGMTRGTHDIPGYSISNFIPFNPTSKYTEATVAQEKDPQNQYRCIKGAPQVIIKMCGGHDGAETAVIDFAKHGLRALGVARTIDPEMTKFEMVGLISLLDPPRADSAKTIKECEELGVSVKMITGDQTIIAKEVAHRLGMQRVILDATKLVDPNLNVDDVTRRVEKADGFAQVIPEHKYRVVELLQNKGFLVGMTGDGVNDAPALKKANVGIAVEGCTDAARSAADIVLLAAGLSTIVDGVKTSRAIFQRMRSYALYRIASTIHFLLFFFISILVDGFTLPDKLIILIAVLNDAATLVISIDNARINHRPDKWRLGQLITLSFILGILLCIISFGHYILAKSSLFSDTIDHHKLTTIMYLQISSCPHFVIFSTRLSTHFWKNAPSWQFAVAVGGTQVFAMFMSIFGVPAFDAEAIGWGWGLGIMAVSIVSFMLLDFVKVFVFKHWSFELTATLWPTPSRRAELARRQGEKERKERIRVSVGKVRKVGRAIFAASILSSAAGKKQRLSKK